MELQDKEAAFEENADVLEEYDGGVLRRLQSLLGLATRPKILDPALIKCLDVLYQICTNEVAVNELFSVRGRLAFFFTDIAPLTIGNIMWQAIGDPGGSQLVAWLPERG